MDWDDLKYVLETVRHGGLSGAARALGVNHATVARRIAAAEANLGAALFDRRPSGYAPTQAGRDAARTAETFETEHATLSRSIAARDAALSGPLTVTAPQLMVQTVLAPIFGAFARAHPDIELTILGAIETLNLAEREADVAIRISDAPDPDLVGRQAAVQKSAVYASVEYVAALEKDPERQLHWLRFLHWQPAPRDVLAVYPNTRTVMKLDDMIAMLGALREGLGASRVPCIIGDRDPALARVPGLPLMPYRPIWVLTHADLRAVPRIAAFTEFVSTALRKQRGAFAGEAT
ncbi:LysR family transcriptional regulator [Tateyamaria omphalii]|uniref:LysR family transcriptional regulator n=1 Tax=Tateyamaria omphalii TaxID=299262 RepID=UPI001C992B6E|nr:LysR family transcriptional regulator [Tateyamaria omphalii]MBY5932221.1 LysR family transcriptional regulator [Tateyamaria omphalii]